jgi:hypothetical protein
MSKARAVNAFLIEMSMLPIQASSIRTCATRFPPASATAMFIGWPIFVAFFCAAAITRCASSSLTIGTSAMAGTHHPAIESSWEEHMVMQDLSRKFTRGRRDRLLVPSTRATGRSGRAWS